MSAEFMIEYSDSTISAAIETMNQASSAHTYVGDYILEIQNQINSKRPQPEDGPGPKFHGRAELIQMIRVAEFIVNEKTKNASEEIQSFYHGELLGMEMINHIHTDSLNPYKSGIAHRFYQNRLDEDRPDYLENPLPESKVDQEYRFNVLSEGMQIELSDPEEINSYHPMLEQFGQKLTKDLTDNPAQQNLAMMGYRLIVTETLNPSIESTPDLLDYVYKSTKQAPLLRGTRQAMRNMGYQFNETPADIEREQEMLLFDELLEDAPDIKFEDIQMVRTNMLRKYFQLNANISIRTPTGRARLEMAMNKFNAEYDLVQPDDILNFSGKFFSIVSDKTGEYGIQNPQLAVEMRGRFGGFHIIDAPSVEQLNQAIVHPEKFANEPPRDLVALPAIRIVDPVFIIHSQALKSESRLGTGLTIDIPLNYETVKYERLSREAFED